MPQQDFHFSYSVYESQGDLSSEDATLLRTAREATAHAYAPYSGFKVGAAAMLASGQVVTGSNQENASFPAGICAERVLLSVVGERHPGESIRSMAISYHNTRLSGGSDKSVAPSGPITPCGICRQSLAEYQARTGQPIRLILGGAEGPVWIIHDATVLLPLAFGSGDL